MPTITKPQTTSFTIRDMYRYSDMELGCSTDGRLPPGEWQLYRISKTGKLTAMPIGPSLDLPLTDDLVIFYGKNADPAMSLEDFSTLGASGLGLFVTLSKDWIARNTPDNDPEPVTPAAPVAPATPEKPDVIAEARDIIQAAQRVVVTNAKEFEDAGNLLKDVKRLIKEVGTSFDPLIEQANRLHKDALAKKAEHVDPLKKAESLLKTEISDYTIAEQRRIEAARRAAEEIRLKAEAEQRRLADEALAAAQAARIADIDAAITSGNVAAAAELSEAPVLVEVPVSPVVPTFIKDEPPKMSGISTRTTYHAEVNDFMALIQAVCANPALCDCLQPNMTELNRIARSSVGGKDGLSIPGVRFVADQTVSVRT